MNRKILIIQSYFSNSLKLNPLDFNLENSVRNFIENNVKCPKSHLTRIKSRFFIIYIFEYAKLVITNFYSISNILIKMLLNL